MIVLLVAAALLAVAALPASAQESQMEAASLATVASLRCEALARGKLATQQADIYRSEASRSMGPGRVHAEQKVTEAQAKAGAAFEEAGRLKTRLKGMIETYVSQQKLKWYETVDLAVRIDLEDKIRFARELGEEGCS